MGFNIDMSPLERSSRAMGGTLGSIGGVISNAIKDNRRAEQEQQLLQQQQSQQEQMRGLMLQAAQGDTQAIEQLYAVNPDIAKQFEDRVLGQQSRVQGERAMATADAVEKLHFLPDEQKEQMFNALVDDDRYDIDEDDRPYFMDPNARKAVIAGVKGQEYADNLFGGEGEDFTLKAGEKRFDAQGNVIAEVGAQSVDAVEIPEILLEGLSDELATKASAAYKAAGGGKDGLVAYNRQIDKGTEQERRASSPAILKSMFTKASDAEMAQLQGAMDAAKTTEAGLKVATKMREEQKRLVKAKGFQDRAVELLTNIINSPDIGDVTGSLEGAYDFRLFSDDESSLIADIEEAGNILTADNLSLMSGVLSESDIKILKNLAGGALIRTRSADRFKRDVTRMRDKLASKKVLTTDERLGKKPKSKYKIEVVE